MKNLLLKAIITLFLLFVVFTSCNKKCDNVTVTPVKVTIGMMLPLTGAGSSNGESTKAAVDIALEDINHYLADIGSALNITLDIQDTQTDSLIAKEKLADMKAKGVQLVIGPYSSAEVAAIKDDADQNGMLIVSPSSVATSLAIPGDNIFRLVPADINQGEAMTAMLMDDNIELLIPIVRDDIWGNELLKTISQQFNEAGGAIEFPIKYSTTTQDYTSYINQLRSKVSFALLQLPAEKIGVYMVSFGEGTDILKLASADTVLGQVRWYGSSAYAENKSLPQDLTAAAFAAIQGLPCPIFGYDETARDKWQPLVERIQAEIGRKPEIYAIAAYDALWLAALTYLKTGVKVDINTLKNVFMFEADNYFGATGRTSLNAAGDRAFATYDFWGIKLFLNEFNWFVVAKYNNATGELVRL